MDTRVVAELPAALADVLARPAAQQPAWPDPARAEEIHRALRRVPPLVTVAETERLRARLAEVARGEALVLQGGDCAETFHGNTEEHLRGNVELLRAVADVLEIGTGLPVVVLGRIAGQYAKPRSRPVDATGLPAYRGDLVNSVVPTAAARTPDPERMLRAYADAAGTLHRLRSFGGAREVFAGHEALLLGYESALVRRAGSRLYGSSGHFLWVGERTRQLDGAHVAFAALVANPVGLKIGATATPDEVLAYVRRLDPDRTPGRLTLISRMGADRVRTALPPIVARVRAAGHPVLWQCDPLHGNTETAPSGHKTRDVGRVADELRGYFDVHRALGTHPGGIHLELTGDDVTECVGDGITLGDLPARYTTACDPRLNVRQALGIAEVAAESIAR
ncbi:3-deoxy-7-phosphoheptulonate synthase [Amycolatopsis sp. cmx-4-83]|uniref:3-deoxy-7-phosphoheptulonate synthase n=1 Tax=Amycolatopsis sp. cmx-4-83 TaxID=2790940 RepID=UPI00397C38D8